MPSVRPAAEVRCRNEDGATMVEYGIVVALISVASIVVISLIGVDIVAALKTVSTMIDGVIGG